MDNLILQYNNRDHFQPVISAVASKNEIEQIFAIPFKNCVGTYYADDGITALECSGEIANQKMVFPLYDSYPLGPGQYFCMLPINKQEIMWGQNMVFDMVNFAKHSDIGYATGLSYTVEQISIIDANKFLFLLKLHLSKNFYDYRLIKLNNPDYSVRSEWAKYDVVSELSSEDELQNDLDHCQRGDFFFFYSEKNHRLQAYDKSLKKTTHPLVDAATGYPFSINKLIVHPILPFAFFISRDENEEGYKKQHFSIVRWEHEDNKMRLIPYPFETILGYKSSDDPLFLSDIIFSPDGNWIIIHDDTYGTDCPEIVAFPIQKDNPMYLGKPVFLGKVMREDAKMLSHAWIEEPMKYVICDGKLLYSWELGKLNDKLEFKK